MDQRIVKTKQALIAALKELIIHQAIDRITVTELCTRAAVNRSTFYKYYATPIDLFEELLGQFTEQILLPLKQAKTREEIEAMLLIMFNIYQTNCWLVHLFDSNNATLLMSMQKRLIPYKNMQLDRHVMSFFVSGGIALVTMQWIREGCSIPPNRLATEIVVMIERLNPTNEESST